MSVRGAHALLLMSEAAMRAGRSSSSSLSVQSGSCENVVCVVHGADGAVLPARFNEVVAEEVGEPVV